MGAGLSELLKAVVFVAQRTTKFKSNLSALRNTLELVKPVFVAREFNEVLDHPDEETRSQFIDQINIGASLVYKCSTVSYWKKRSHSKKLVKLDKSIVKFSVWMYWIH